jgi:D-ribose pyranase
MKHDGWQYRRISGEPDLDQLGAEGWELVALRGEEWILKRAAPDPTERFTLEQRTAAIATPAGPAGTGAERRQGAERHTGRRLLNPQIAALIRQVNHTQMLLLADRGFPVPPLPLVVDISLTTDIPTIPQVLAAILPDLPADRIILAGEQEQTSPGRWKEHREGPLAVEVVPHLEFKRLAGYAVGCIRTWDSAPYANCLVVGG